MKANELFFPRSIVSGVYCAVQDGSTFVSELG